MSADSIELVARSSDDAVVRQRFDAHNVVWLPIVFVGFLFVTLVEIIMSISMASEWRLLNAVTNLMLIAFGLLVMRDVHRGETVKGFHGLSRRVTRYTSASILIYLAVQFLLVVLFARHNWIVWAMAFPLILVGFRLLVIEILLMHGFMIAVFVVQVLLGRLRPGTMMAVLTGTVLIHAISIAIEMLTARRLKRETISDWTERRIQAREQIRMRDELQYARELQLSMLPEAAPQLDWLDLAGTSIPASEVGGDYYDYFLVGDGVALVCGDVAGHGMGSGIVLSALRSGFTLLRESLDRPAAVMQRLHELVAQSSRRRMLATAAVLLVDPQSRRVTFASAGHPPLIVRDSSGVRLVELFAPPLGVRLPLRVPELTFPFATGDLFVLHSDGIYEALSESGEVYGLERLLALVAAHSGSADELRDTIVRDVDTFRGTAAQADDVTLVIAQVRGRKED